MKRIFAIGDIHGHFDQLVELINTLQSEAGFDPHKEHLVLLGDLVDNGSQTRQVLEFAMSWSKQFPENVHVLKGNHEDMLLDALNPAHPKYHDYYIWWNQGGRATLKSYTDEFDATDYEKAIMQPSDYITKEHIAFLATLPVYWETDEYFFVHGGVLPGTKLAKHDFDDPVVQDRMLWIRDDFIQSTFHWEKKIIFGHTGKDTSGGQYSNFEPWVMKNKIGINTMPRNLGYLTALELPAEKFHQPGKIA